MGQCDIKPLLSSQIVFSVLFIPRAWVKRGKKILQGVAKFFSGGYYVPLIFSIKVSLNFHANIQQNVQIIKSCFSTDCVPVALQTTVLGPGPFFFLKSNSISPCRLIYKAMPCECPCFFIAYMCRLLTPDCSLNACQIFSRMNVRLLTRSPKSGLATLSPQTFHET